MKGTVVSSIPPDINNLSIPEDSTLRISMSLVEYCFWMWRVDEIQIDYAYDILDTAIPFIEAGTVTIRKATTGGMGVEALATELDVLKKTWDGSTQGPYYNADGTDIINGSLFFNPCRQYFQLIHPPTAPNYETVLYLFANLFGGFVTTDDGGGANDPTGTFCTLSGGSDPLSGQVFPDIVREFFNSTPGSITVNSGFMTITPATYYRWRDAANNPTYNTNGTLA